MSPNYNNDRKNKPRSFNTRAVFTESAKDITPTEKQAAQKRNADVIKATKEKLK